MELIVKELQFLTNLSSNIDMTNRIRDYVLIINNK